MADNLEKYFKKHLSDETQGPDNWNVPSDDVWNKVEPELQKPRGLFIPWNFVYLAGIAVLLGVGLLLWPDFNGEQAGEGQPAGSEMSDVVIFEGEMDAKQEEDLTGPGTSQVPGPGSAEVTDSRGEHATAASPEGASQDNGNKADEFVAVRKENPGDLTGSGTSQVQEMIDNDGLYIEYSGTTGQEQEPAGRGDPVPGMPSVSSSDIPYVNAREISGTTLKEIESFTIEEYYQPPDIYDNSKKFAVGALFTPTWNSTYVLGSAPSGVLETASNMYLYSNSWGAEFRYYFNKKWSVSTGMERSEHISWSRSTIDFSYDRSTENSMPGGKKENTSPVPMATPFGEIGTEITYQFAGEENIPDGEVMNSVLETHQEVRYLSIPLGVEYSILPVGRFNWFAEGGLRFNRAIRDATDFTSRIVHQGHEMEVVGEKMMNHPNYTRHYLGYYAGTGLNFQFSKRFLIHGSGRYFGNITRVNQQGDLGTNVHGFSLKLGFLYFF